MQDRPSGKNGVRAANRYRAARRRTPARCRRGRGRSPCGHRLSTSRARRAGARGQRFAATWASRSSRKIVTTELPAPSGCSTTQTDRSSASVHTASLREGRTSVRCATARTMFELLGSPGRGDRRRGATTQIASLRSNLAASSRGAHPVSLTTLNERPTNLHPRQRRSGRVFRAH